MALPDKWEIDNQLIPTYKGDAILDFDGDGLSNLEEFAIGSDIYNADTDSDGVSDRYDQLPLLDSEQFDFDQDGVGDLADLDDDNDGLSDIFEFQSGLNPKDATDASEDLDHDGKSNLEEYKEGTNINDRESVAYAFHEINPFTETIRVQAGKEFLIHLYYSQKGNEFSTDGLNLNLYYDSSFVEFVRVQASYVPGQNYSGIVNEDSGSGDSAEKTDKYVSFSWSSKNYEWKPDNGTKILSLKMKMLGSVGDTSKSLVAIKSSGNSFTETNELIGLSSKLITIYEGAPINFDINGDGLVEGLVDGAIISRYMLGYPAESLATESELTNSTRTREEIYRLLQSMNTLDQQ